MDMARFRLFLPGQDTFGCCWIVAEDSIWLLNVLYDGGCFWPVLDDSGRLSPDLWLAF